MQSQATSSQSPVSLEEMLAAIRAVGATDQQPLGKIDFGVTDVLPEHMHLVVTPMPEFMGCVGAVFVRPEFLRAARAAGLTDDDVKAAAWQMATRDWAARGVSRRAVTAAQIAPRLT